MKRIELIFNRSVEEDVLNHMEETGLEFFYTIHPVVLGQGSAGPRMGDHIWPEENMIYLFYAEEEILNALIDIKDKIKKIFPDEGIKLFSSPAEEH